MDDASYVFVRRDQQDEIAPIPADVRTEILAFVLLAPFAVAGLDRQYAREFVASDASPSFGFGVVAARCSLELSAWVCSLSERRGDFIRLYLPEETERKDRIGVPRQSCAVCRPLGFP